MHKNRHDICRPLTIMLSFLLLFCMVAFGNCINLERVRQAAAAVLSEQTVNEAEGPVFVIRSAERGLLSLIADGEEPEDSSLFATREFRSFPGAEFTEETLPVEMPAVRKPGRSVSVFEKKTEEAAGDPVVMLFLLLLLYTVCSRQYAIPIRICRKESGSIRLTLGRYPPLLTMD